MSRPYSTTNKLKSIYLPYDTCIYDFIQALVEEGRKLWELGTYYSDIGKETSNWCEAKNIVPWIERTADGNKYVVVEVLFINDKFISRDILQGLIRIKEYL